MFPKRACLVRRESPLPSLFKYNGPLLFHPPSVSFYHITVFYFEEPKLLHFYYYSIYTMAFLQTDIDPLYLREKHLRMSESSNNSISAQASASTTSIDDTDHFTEMDFDDHHHHHQEGAVSAVKRFFEFGSSTMSSSSKTGGRRSTFSRKENLDRLVSFYL